MKKIIFSLIFLLIPALVCAQEVDTKSKLFILFNALIKDETKTKEHLVQLARYQQKTPYKMESILSVSRQLLVWGWQPEEILNLMKPCGDAAATVSGSDESFADLTLTLGRMKFDEKDSYSYLLRIDRMGLPIWKMIGNAIGKSAAEAERYSQHNQLKPGPTTTLLCQQFNILYKGMAEKLAEAK